MYSQDGQHYMAQTTEEDSEKHRAAFQEWMECVEANTTVICQKLPGSLPNVGKHLSRYSVGRVWKQRSSHCDQGTYSGDVLPCGPFDCLGRKDVYPRIGV
jgi:hypothetical protein